MESDRVDKLCRRRFDRTELEPASSPVCDFLRHFYARFIIVAGVLPLAGTPQFPPAPAFCPDTSCQQTPTRRN